MTLPAAFERSITGQAWRWRGAGGEADDLVTQLLLARGCPFEELDAYRSPTIRAFMPDPSIFRDMESAAARIADAVMSNEKVTIFGDYDVDGATSAALLIRLLRQLGLEAGYYIPDRLLEGYGPSGDALVSLAASGSTLVVTVDCGAQALTTPPPPADRHLASQGDAWYPRAHRTNEARSDPQQSAKTQN